MKNNISPERIKIIKNLLKTLLKECKTRKGNVRAIAEKNNGMIHYETCKELLIWDEKKLTFILDLIENKKISPKDSAEQMTLEEKIEILKKERREKC